MITSLVADLFPVVSPYGGGLYYAAEDASAVLHAYRRWTGTLPKTPARRWRCCACRLDPHECRHADR